MLLRMGYVGQNLVLAVVDVHGGYLGAVGR